MDFPRVTSVSSSSVLLPSLSCVSLSHRCASGLRSANATPLRAAYVFLTLALRQHLSPSPSPCLRSQGKGGQDPTVPSQPFPIRSSLRSVCRLSPPPTTPWSSKSCTLRHVGRVTPSSFPCEPGKGDPRQAEDSEDRSSHPVGRADRCGHCPRRVRDALTGFTSSPVHLTRQGLDVRGRIVRCSLHPSAPPRHLPPVDAGLPGEQYGGSVAPSFRHRPARGTRTEPRSVPSHTLPSLTLCSFVAHAAALRPVERHISLPPPTPPEAGPSLTGSISLLLREIPPFARCEGIARRDGVHLSSSFSISPSARSQGHGRRKNFKDCVINFFRPTLDTSRPVLLCQHRQRENPSHRRKALFDNNHTEKRQLKGLQQMN